MKCQICKDEQASWAWQPFGPDELPDSFAFLGSHYRGFPVIKVGDSCKHAFQSGDFEVKFSYEGHLFVGKDHRIKEVHISLWKSDRISTDQLNPGPATMIMKDAFEGGPELVALVFDTKTYPAPELVNIFVAAPGLVETCDELDALRSKIERWSQMAWINAEDRRAVLMALAGVHVQLKRAHGEE